MRIDIITVLPELLTGPFAHSIVKRACDKGIAEISIAKHRNGEIGMKRLAFIGQYTKFANLALGGGGSST